MKLISTNMMMMAKINEATSTKMALLCSSLNLGHVTLVRISSMESRMYVFTFSIFVVFGQIPLSCDFPGLLLHGWRDSNSQPTVLETATLPIELHPFLVGF